MEKFSYSKLSVMEQCPYKYKLVYKDKHFIEDKTIAQDFGTLVHFIEESIGKEIIKQNYYFEKINIDTFIDMFINLDDSENKIYGMKKLKQLYPEIFNEKDKNDLDYTDKGNIYLEKGIYRLINFLKSNPDLEIIGLEKEFNLKYDEKYIFHGFIDRIFQNKNTKELFIEDIKTYSNVLEKKDLTTPLQFVFYTLAAKELFNINEENINCFYEIPLCDIKQEAGTKGFIKRGINKINDLLEKINQNIIEPKPSPLCAFCNFSPTNKKNITEENYLCPYYCLWTRQNKTFEVNHYWMGVEKHEIIMKNYLENLKNINTDKHLIKKNISNNIDNTLSPTHRFFILRK